METYISPWIFTTTRCNLACPYCYVKQDGRDMDDKTYSRINKIFLNMIRNKEKDIVIYRLAGGEPLLMFNKWKSHMNYFLNEAGEHGFVSIITNLTELNDDMLEDVVSVILTLDLTTVWTSLTVPVAASTTCRPIT